MKAVSNKEYHNEHFYDIIGDVHGHHLELQKLLLKLEYSLVNGVWAHRYRKAVFVGDFINRGSNSRGVIKIIRDMINAGTGLAILGNHEVNAILYFTKDKYGNPLRIPGNNNKRLLDRFKLEYSHKNYALKEDIQWMRTLPLYLELNGIKVVHAYWNDDHISVLPQLYKDGKLSKRKLQEALNEDSPLFLPLWQTIKGVEFCLPGDLVIKDSNRINRNCFRVKWWIKPQGQTFKSLSYGNKFDLPDYTIPNEIISDFKIYPPDAPMVFIGHYRVKKEPMIPAPNICCTDASVVTDGHLAAYRYNGEDIPDENNFVFIRKKDLKK